MAFYSRKHGIHDPTYKQGILLEETRLHGYTVGNHGPAGRGEIAIGMRAYLHERGLPNDQPQLGALLPGFSTGRATGAVPNGRPRAVKVWSEEPRALVIRGIKPCIKRKVDGQWIPYALTYEGRKYVHTAMTSLAAANNVLGPPDPLSEEEYRNLSTPDGVVPPRFL